MRAGEGVDERLEHDRRGQPENRLDRDAGHDEQARARVGPEVAEHPSDHRAPVRGGQFRLAPVHRHGRAYAVPVHSMPPSRAVASPPPYRFTTRLPGGWRPVPRSTGPPPRAGPGRPPSPGSGAPRVRAGPGGPAQAGRPAPSGNRREPPRPPPPRPPRRRARPPASATPPP